MSDQWIAFYSVAIDHTQFLLYSSCYLLLGNKPCLTQWLETAIYLFQILQFGHNLEGVAHFSFVGHGLGPLVSLQLAGASKMAPHPLGPQSV
jgi:hypothetical protein